VAATLRYLVESNPTRGRTKGDSIEVVERGPISDEGGSRDSETRAASRRMNHSRVMVNGTEGARSNVDKSSNASERAPRAMVSL